MKPPAAPFGHIVIPAPDLEKARRFYEGVFGWTVRRNEPGPGYWFFESGNVGGALDRDGQPAAGSVRLILRVTDMAETLELHRGARWNGHPGTRSDRRGGPGVRRVLPRPERQRAGDLLGPLRRQEPRETSSTVPCGRVFPAARSRGRRRTGRPPCLPADRTRTGTRRRREGPRRRRQSSSRPARTTGASASAGCPRFAKGLIVPRTPAEARRRRSSSSGAWPA